MQPQYKISINLYTCNGSLFLLLYISAANFFEILLCKLPSPLLPYVQCLFNSCITVCQMHIVYILSKIYFISVTFTLNTDLRTKYLESPSLDIKTWYFFTKDRVNLVDT